MASTTPQTSSGDTAADTGLSAATAARRLVEEGPNALPGGGRRTLLAIAAETVREPMFLLLLAAGTLYLVLGDLREGLTLFGFVLVTLALTLFQEGRTERAIDALRDLTSPRALVIRDGKRQRIPGREVVRGDLLALDEGDRVPADAWLVGGDGILADESLLTGESVPVGKRCARADELDAAAAGRAPRTPPGGDGQPMVYGGTLIVQGRALARVSATGERSEIGRIGAALGAVARERTPLQRQTARLVRNLALLALALSLLLVLVHGIRRGEWLQALLEIGRAHV
jgi:Ca2+-transporting ATPase